ncbi:MAG: protein kinase [Chloroflexota bacterium]|nr:protein kinase [Chloroflexota bacterium]
MDEEHQRAYAALQNEVKILKKARHLNIARIYPLNSRALSLQEERYLSQHDFRDEAWWFWAMEHLEGDSLARRMKGKRLPLEEAAEVTYQLAEALDYIHSKGIVYLNIHPKSILFRYPLSGPDMGLGPRRVELVLTGFGNAASADQPGAIDERMTEGRFESYVPPECIRPDRASDQPLDSRPKDVYSLGVLFYHMLAGVPPFTGSDEEDIKRAILGADPPPLLRFDVPIEVEELIFKALQKDPAGRPTMEQLLISLDKSVPPPRVVGSRIRVPIGDGGALADGTRAHTLPYTSDVSRPFDVRGGDEVVPPAPTFSEKFKAAMSKLIPSGRKRYPVPKLLEPADGLTIDERVIFSWHWKRELENDEAFELRIWREGEDHGRAGEPQKESMVEVDLDTLMYNIPGEGAECFWSVAVVRPYPYESLSKEAKSHGFVYGESSELEGLEEGTGDGTEDLAGVGAYEGD